MAIPASKIVAVYPRLIRAGNSELEINGLFLTDNPVLPFPTVFSFDSKDAVKKYFGDDSAEFNLATKYFLGYDNSWRKPRTLYFARRALTALAAFIQGAAINAALSDFTAITSGEIIITIDGNEITLSDIDLSPATSFSAVAAVLETYLQQSAPEATVTWSSLTKGFTVTSGTSGIGSNVSYAGDGELAALMKLRQEDAGYLSKGSETLTGMANMNIIYEQTQNYVTFSTVYDADKSEQLSLAEWSNAQGEEYLYCLWSLDSALASQQDTTSIAKLLEEEDLGSVAGVYGDAEYAAFIMGTAASIDWNRRGGAINFAFKKQEGLAPTITDGNTSDVLLAKKFNFYGRYGTRNDNFIHLYNGCMFGRWSFIDPFINGVWLRNNIQLSLMAGLQQSARTPYNEAGYALVRAWMSDPIERALNNGVIEAGVSLSNSQKAELIQEAGIDISTQLFTNGYYLQILDPGAAVRAQRESPVISLWYTYGGSINKLEVAATAVL